MNLSSSKNKAPDRPAGSEAGSSKSLLPPNAFPIAAALAWWVECARRFAWPILIGSIALTVVSAWYTAGHLGMNTDNSTLISQKLQYWKDFRAFERDFPQLRDNIVIVVEGDSPDRAEDAANALAAKLQQDMDAFQDIFFPNGDPFFRREGLLFLETKELQDLSDRLAQAQPLLGTLINDPSLRGLFGVLGQAAEGIKLGAVDPSLLVRPLTMIGDTIDAQLAGKPARLSWRDLMTGLPDRPSDRQQIILLRAKDGQGGLDPDGAVKLIRSTAASLSLDPAHGVRVRLTGGPVMDQEELASVQDGAGLASAVSLVLVTILVLLGLRSPKLIVATLLTLLLSLVWTAGFAALAIGYLNLISVAFAVLFIGLAVDFSIQFGLRYKEGIDLGESLPRALRSAATGTGVAVGLAALCAAIGFFAFIPTEYVGLSQLGIIAAVGMFIGLFATLTLLPAMLALMPLRPRLRPNDERNGNPIAIFLERHSRAVCIGGLVLGIVSLSALPFVQFDIDPIHLKDPNTESVQTYFDITKDSANSPYSINIVTPSLADADAMAKQLDKLPEVDSTVTLSSFIPQNQDSKLALIDQMATFLTPVLQGGEKKAPPTDAERAKATEDLRRSLLELAASPKAGAVKAPAQRLADLLGRFASGPGRDVAAYGQLGDALMASLPGRLNGLFELMKAEPVTLASIPANIKARYVDADGKARIEVSPTGRIMNQATLRRFVNAVQAIAPHATDTPVLLLDGGKVVIGAFEEAGAIAFVAITLLLLIVLRSFWDSLLVLLPLALAAVLTIAIVVLSGLKFNFANIIALPLLFSLGVAFGIYLVMRHRETHRVADLLRTSTPRAVLFSALTTMVSFSSLMVSPHRGMASMGYLLGICLTLALICTLVVLPSLLAWREQRRHRPR